MAEKKPTVEELEAQLKAAKEQAKTLAEENKELKEKISPEPEKVDPQKDIVIVYGRGEVGTVGFTARKTVWGLSPMGGNDKVAMQDDTKRISLPFSLKKGEDAVDGYRYTALLDHNIAASMGVSVAEAREAIETHEEFTTGKIKILYEGKDRSKATKIAWTAKPENKPDVVQGGRGTGAV